MDTGRFGHAGHLSVGGVTPFAGGEQPPTAPGAALPGTDRRSAAGGSGGGWSIDGGAWPNEFPADRGAPGVVASGEGVGEGVPLHPAPGFPMPPPQGAVPGQADGGSGRDAPPPVGDAPAGRTGGWGPPGGLGSPAAPGYNSRGGHFPPSVAPSAQSPAPGWPMGPSHGAYPPPPGQPPGHMPPPYAYGSPPQHYAGHGGYAAFLRPQQLHPQHPQVLRQPLPPQGPHPSFAPPYAPGYGRPYAPPYGQPPRHGGGVGGGLEAAHGGPSLGASPPASSYVPRPGPAVGGEYASAPSAYAPGAGAPGNGGWPAPGPPPPQVPSQMDSSPILAPLSQPRPSAAQQMEPQQPQQAPHVPQQPQQQQWQQPEQPCAPWAAAEPEVPSYTADPSPSAPPLGPTLSAPSPSAPPPPRQPVERAESSEMPVHPSRYGTQMIRLEDLEASLSTMALPPSSPRESAPPVVSPPVAPSFVPGPEPPLAPLGVPPAADAHPSAAQPSRTMASPWSFNRAESNGSSSGLFGIASVGGLDFPSLAEAARAPFAARTSPIAAAAAPHAAAGAPVTSTSLTSVLRSAAIPPPVAPARRKQLPAMTTREIETVLRMHLKHLEMSDPYIEDYYNLALKAKREGVADFGAIGPGDSLGARLLPVSGKRHAPLGDADMRGHLAAAARSRASGAAGASSSAAGSSSSLSRLPSGAGQTHTEANLMTLASALGTLQRWTPNAPRKLVKVSQPPSALDGTGGGGVGVRGDPSTASKAAGGGGGGVLSGSSAPPPLALRKDEGVAVRMAVEQGYDILADVWDVVRRRRRGDTPAVNASADDARVATIEELIDRLYTVLRLPEPATDAAAPLTPSNAAFFVRMCAFAKGKRFIAAALPLLPLRRQQVAVAAVMRHLGALADVRVAALQASSEGGRRQTTSGASSGAGAPGSAPVGAMAFWPALVASVRDDEEAAGGGPVGAAAAASAATALLDAFLAGHSRAGVVAALTSGDGARLLYACLERIPPPGGASQEVAAAADRAASLETARRVCAAMTAALPDVFAACESPDAVWLVVALLDALAGADEQATLRATLTGLLESGRAPPPPPPPQQS